MRWLLLLLLIANILLFGSFRGWFGQESPPVELHPERLQVVPLERPHRPGADAGIPPVDSGSAVARAPVAEPAGDSSVAIPPAAENAGTLAAGPGVPPIGVPVASEAPSSDAAPAGSAAPAADETIAADAMTGPSRPATETPIEAVSAAASVPSQPEPTPAPPPMTPAAAGEPVTPTAAVVCREFAGLDDARARQLLAALERSGAQVEQQRIEPTSHLVHLAPADTLPEARQRAEEVRRAGVADAYVVPDGSLRLAVSIGLFGKEEAARAFARQVADRLNPALAAAVRISPRPPGAGTVRLLARWRDAAAMAAASEWVAMATRIC